MASTMNFDEIRTALSDPASVQAKPFELLQEIALRVNNDETEEQGRELVLRALDQRTQFEDYAEVLDALTRQVGLFPYLERESLALRDRIAYEFHRPEGEG